MPTEEQDKEIARRYAEEVWGEGDVEVMDELFTEDQTVHLSTRSGEEHLDESKSSSKCFTLCFPILATR